MRRTVILPLALAALTLGGCGPQDDQPEAGQANQAAQAAQAADGSIAEHPQPGRYRATMRMIDVSFPGMPAQVAAQMKTMFGAEGHSSEYCLTPEKAKAGYQEFTRHAAEGDCRYDSFKAEGGQLDARMTCQTARGMTTKAVVAGSFSPTGSKLKMTGDTSGADLPGGGMHVEAEVTTERIGDCKA